LYYQCVNWLKFGRLPTQAIIDIHGMLRYIYRGQSMADIPSPQSMLNQVLCLPL
jgi:hypothetical protein